MKQVITYLLRMQWTSDANER